jgi:uncharacterized repeat protein (TIGR01451 family)
MQFSYLLAGFRAPSWRRGAAALLLGAGWLIGAQTPVQAAPAPAGAVIRSQATATYVPAGLAQTQTVSSNMVIATVLPVEALVLTQDQTVSRPPASIVTLSHLLSNTGNVASSYTLGLANNGAGCAADTLDLSGLRVLRDTNNNGVADASDPVVPLNVAGALSLQPGETAALLVQGTVPTAASGAACIGLTAVTAQQGLSASNRDTVQVGAAAALTLVKSASYPGIVVPGQTRIDFSISGTNIGAQDAQPGNLIAPANTPLLVNGSPAALVLVRDLVPAGTQYLPGTLQTTAANAVRLFRLAADPPFSYRTAEDASAVEVAKAWGAGNIAGNVARIGSTTGGAANTAVLTSTAPTNSATAAVSVLVGNTITLPAETMTTGTLANYTTVLSCTAGGGPTANALSGTNGQVANTLTIGPGDLGKAIVCTYTNAWKTATLQLRKAWAATAVAGDVATIAATTGGTANTAAFSATSPVAGDSGAAVTVRAGNTITLPAETMAAGALANYTTVLSCTADGGATANALSGTNGQTANTLAIGIADANKAIVCTYTNTPKTTTLQLTKAWSAGSLAGHVASIGASSGAAIDTGAFTATAPTAASSSVGAVVVGALVTLPAETMPTGSIAAYNTVLSCTAGGGATANALSGTNGQVANTLRIGAGDLGKAIVCTYTNTPKPTTLQVAKAWGASSVAGHVARIGATTGGAANTAVLNSTAPTGSSTAAVTVQVGNTITFPAETMTTGTLSNYVTVLSCTADGGATANALSGTNGQATNSLTIGAGDFGKAIVCTYVNSSLPTLQIRKQALGGTGTFSFSGGNGFGSDSITVGAPGMTVAGAVRTLSAPNVQTVVTEALGAMPPGFAFSIASCTGLSGAAQAAVDTAAGTITLPAAGLDLGAAVVCTFTNTLAASVSGRVFLDNGVGSGTANDGVPNGGEGGLAGVSVRLTNCAATVYATALTDASGNYSLAVPTGTAAGTSLCVEETNTGTRVSTGASVGGVALPSGAATAAPGGTYTYTRTGTPDRIAFAWNGTGHSNLNFGDVDNGSFATDGAKTAQPGSTVTYGHTFTAGTAGQVSFAITSDTATPIITGWSTRIFADPACTGSLQPGATQLYPPGTTATPVAFAGKVCIVVQTFVPATAPQGASDRVTVQASFDYTNANPSLAGTFTLTDITTVSSVALDLKKEVRNVTQGGTFGINNQAKSGETVEYRITYTNNGDAPIRSMTVNDTTPGYTSFLSATTGATPPTLTACAKNTPANALPAAAVPCATAQPVGGTGPIEWRFTGSVDPGGTGTVLFQVKVD